MSDFLTDNDVANYEDYGADGCFGKKFDFRSVCMKHFEGRMAEAAQLSEKYVAHLIKKQGMRNIKRCGKR